MKNIVDYIEQTEQDSFINESLLSHIAIEYKVNDISEGSRIINEKYGIYNGCEELVDFIVKDIFSHDNLDYQFEYNRDTLKDIKNIFFKKLIIDIDTSAEEEYGECDDNLSIDKDLLVEEIWINIYEKKPNKHSIKGTLMHELTHAYNNYMMLLKGNSSFIDTARSDMYRNIIDVRGGNTERDLKFILYFLLGYERNAFIGQLKSELESHRNKINTPKDALEVLKKCPIYKTYLRVDNTIRYHIANSKDSDLIANIYKEITGSDKNESSLKILKRLKSQSDKALKKLNTIIPKLCVENLNNRLWHKERFDLLSE